MIRSLRLFMATLLLGAVVHMPLTAGQPGTFAVQGDQFLLNGKPFRIMSGEMHYPRVPRAYWADRFAKMKAMGLNTLCTYVFWNAHELKPGEFTFEGNLDLAEYIREAQKAGLYVIVRPGPYVCSEWDFGGLPSWLLREPDIKLRCSDPRYMAAARRYIEHLGKELKGLQISEGGPVILVQLENEYGSYGNDKQYLRDLRDILRGAGFTVPLFTSDGGAQYLLESGTLPEITPVVNFGGGAEGEFGALTAFRQNIPLMCGEYWCGWFTHWSDSLWGRSDATKQVKELEWMLTTGKSFNLYMFHGGTNFGFTAGSNYAKLFEPDVTSYDYDAPVDEAGRPTPKYHIFRDLLQKQAYNGKKLPDVPRPLPMIEIPSITLTEQAGLLASLPAPIHMVQPQPMESFGQAHGLVLYRTKMIGPRSGKLVITELHDYASVYVNGKLIGRIDRMRGENMIEIPKGVADGDATLDILVEAMGRVNFGDRLVDRKGITERVTLAGVTLMNWDAYPVPMDAAFLATLRFAPGAAAAPGFFRGTFDLTTVGDTYLDMKGWKKGLVWINGHNLGRFWDAGPQERLFVPGCWLTKGKNEILVFDIDRTQASPLRTVTAMK
jgi:beta-galactosidase